MTHRANLTSAAFWHGRVCLACGEGQEDDGAAPDPECPECGEEALVDARALQGWLGRLLGEEEEG